MIRFESVTFTYPGAETPVLVDVDLTVPEGELCLVVGPTGVGKSTLLRAINGLAPRFTGGLLAGRVMVAERDTRTTDLRSMADLVGAVGQDPAAGFVTETVEDELAYTMEQLGVDPGTMRKRVEETLDLLGLADLRSRNLATLSGGQAQRVAIGSVLTAHPSVLVLDEPTSALDPTGAEEVLAAIIRLVHDLGVTVVVAEHRLERVVQYADRVVEVDRKGGVRSGRPESMMETATVAPPVVELARLVGWSPVPLSIRDARRRASGLASRLDTAPPNRFDATLRSPAARVSHLSVVHDGVVAVREVDLEVGAGTVAALMGRNGAGKSSLLWAIQGRGRRRSGAVEVSGRDPADLPPPEARSLVGLVPQQPGDLLYLESVADECAQADSESAASAGTCWEILQRLVGDVAPDAHPSDLSEGQRLGLVLAIQLTARPSVVLLDEPTRGLDYHAKRRLGEVMVELAGEGHAVVVATHDVEFVAEVADRVLVMAEGEIVADGPTSEVVVASPAFAPQVAKILAPAQWLTVAEVAIGLSGEAV